MSDAIRTPTPYTATAPIGRKSTMAILALIAAFIFPVLGVILGTIALVQTSKSGQSGRGLRSPLSSSARLSRLPTCLCSTSAPSSTTAGATRQFA